MCIRDRSQVNQRLQAYVSRIDTLQQSIHSKDTEIILLRGCLKEMENTISNLYQQRKQNYSNTRAEYRKQLGEANDILARLKANCLNLIFSCLDIQDLIRIRSVSSGFRILVINALKVRLPQLESPDPNLCVASLNKNHIAEVRSFANPPILVFHVLRITASILNDKIVEADWSKVKGYLANLDNFMADLRNFKGKIKPEVVEMAKKAIQEHSMSPVSVAPISFAASKMMEWIILYVYNSEEVRKYRLRSSVERLIGSQNDLSLIHI
eukprot:TRINITY_DN6422_c0_g2_i2.p1 TRINITY_DN6422_c0_g2~~TRINITY_DN6422_c0_g2_i2.p1  ORF type:complete len:267 (+),score=35.08 TRINITY_DN6422_c0_g2_i2:66-866(+)